MNTNKNDYFRSQISVLLMNKGAREQEIVVYKQTCMFENSNLTILSEMCLGSLTKKQFPNKKSCTSVVTDTFMEEQGTDDWVKK